MRARPHARLTLPDRFPSRDLLRREPENNDGTSFVGGKE
jgi:hypothetical protein